ncbi:triose-phosphate isomerase family protein [Arthrobacter sp. GCM10027362]|uniref:triose-phosphate isomerase family protein n=1 Tax=Arthrobacter sp. GCM10027362 TaxID=3273379 RepID=UPI00363CA498
MAAVTYVGVSTKMYLGYRDSLAWLKQVRTLLLARRGSRVRSFVAPSFPVLESARRLLEDTGAVLGAQDCSWGDGPLTGEVSAGMLAELGVELVVLGHAERRRLFGEDDAVVARKLRAAVGAGLTPLLCIGEAEEQGAAAAADFCQRQVLSALAGNEALLGRLILAYEPVWAIGADAPAEPDYINEVVLRLRGLLGHRPVLYGGSAGPGLLPKLSEVDGLFLGRFAHNPENFGLVLDEAAGPGRNASHA